MKRSMNTTITKTTIIIMRSMIKTMGITIMRMRSMVIMATTMLMGITIMRMRSMVITATAMITSIIITIITGESMMQMMYSRAGGWRQPISTRERSWRIS